MPIRIKRIKFLEMIAGPIDYFTIVTSSFSNLSNLALIPQWDKLKGDVGAVAAMILFHFSLSGAEIKPVFLNCLCLEVAPYSECSHFRMGRAIPHHA
jgi:hypothetical protein